MLSLFSLCNKFINQTDWSPEVFFHDINLTSLQNKEKPVNTGLNQTHEKEKDKDTNIKQILSNRVSICQEQRGMGGTVIKVPPPTMDQFLLFIFFLHGQVFLLNFSPDQESCIVVTANLNFNSSWE